jgi:hypothetical protein
MSHLHIRTYYVKMITSIVKYIVQGWFWLENKNWFELFLSGVKLPKVAGHIQNRSKMDHLNKGGVDGFSYFFIDFQLFYFLTRIIPEQYISLWKWSFLRNTYEYVDETWCYNITSNFMFSMMLMRSFTSYVPYST